VLRKKKGWGGGGGGGGGVAVSDHNSQYSRSNSYSFLKTPSYHVKLIC